LRDTVAHDLLDTCFEVRSGHSRYTRQGRLQIQIADSENAFRIILRRIPETDYFFVAGSFALCDQPRAQPPDNRIKPEQGFDGHVHRSSQIVATPNVTELMRKNGFELRRRELAGNAIRHQQDRPPDSEDSRLDEGCGGENRNPVERTYGFRRAERASHLPPASPPGKNNHRKTDRPNCTPDRRKSV